MKLRNHSKVYLLKVWFVTKLIKIKKVISFSGRCHVRKDGTLNKNSGEEVFEGPSESMSKSKKNVIDGDCNKTLRNGIR